jgi:demethylmenaquinone methyltransferase/2-methoxy-6-polyprenyl-1,4-benzoquinol methylase
VTDDETLRQQLAYYRARAAEYDASLGRDDARSAPDPPDWARAVRALRQLAPVEHVLEMACGTGIWTRELLAVGRSITSVDGAPEMLAINQAKLADPRVRYVEADLFAWQPDREYDLVFFAFWLSHMPPERLGDFLDRVQRAIRPGGRLFVIDEPAGGRQVSGPSQSGRQTRILTDGRQFEIVKVYYQPAAISAALWQRGFTSIVAIAGDAFFHLLATRADESLTTGH